jgi:hypothetical protein
MDENWFDGALSALEPFWQAILSGLALAYAWAMAWQMLLAGLLILGAAIIVARAIVKAAALRLPAAKPAVKNMPQPDLRSDGTPLGNPAETPQELAGNLEQLRSMIRSALTSFTLTADKENNPGYFLCQRIAHLHLERFPLPVNANKAARELHAVLLLQLETLRQNLNQNPKKDMPGDVAQLLVQLNTSARSLLAALAAAPDTRLKANSELR